MDVLEHVLDPVGVHAWGVAMRGACIFAMQYAQTHVLQNAKHCVIIHAKISAKATVKEVVIPPAKMDAKVHVRLAARVE